MAESCWQIEGTIARLALGEFRAAIDLTLPAQGLTLRFPGAATAAPWQILGVQFDDGQSVAAGPIDAYVRGNDLVATYEENPPRLVRAQIYWRRLKAADFSPQFAEHVAAALDLIVSVNTSLLDSDPQSKVMSTFPAAHELLSVGGDTSVAENQSLLVRPESGGLCYAEMVHPAEFCRTQINAKLDRSPAAVIHHLFQERLEKGVILRGWIRAALVARKHDAAAALDAYQHFAAAEPPLTV